MKKNLPIKIFEKRKKIDERKTEGGGNDDLPKWAQITDEEIIDRSRSFNVTIDETSSILSHRNPERDFIPAILKVEMHDNATAKSHRPFIASIFDVNKEHNLIGLTDDKNILVKVSNLEEAEEIKKRLNKPLKFKRGIASIINITHFEPEIALDKDDISDEPLRVSLINYHNFNLNQAVSKAFINLCEKNNIDVIKANYSSELIVFRVNNLSLDAFEEMKDFEALETITQMPKYSLTLDDFSVSDETSIPIKKPQKGVTYPIVGILDSGIKNIPHLQPWLLNQNFIKVPSDRIDYKHGTFVSSIVVYGDDFEKQNYIGSNGCYLFDATIIPDPKKDSIEEFELIENIREAIKKNRDQIKIWNLSVGTRDECDVSTFSPFGTALDKIQEENNVIICKSAGNCTNFLTGKPISRIAKSADSIRSLVVGSLAQNKGTYDLSEIHNPSPFSRIGKGPSFINKPELTHMGGNAGINSGKLITTGVTSFSPTGQLATNIGTSFSTPRISSLLAEIHNSLEEEYNPLLLKALAIHSAKFPKDLKLPPEERIKYVGYGVPSNIADILYNDPNEITLILQDTLIKGSWIEIPDLPFPPTMVENGIYYGEIILTLVSAPILSESQGAEYCQSNLEVRLGTYDKLKNRKGRTIRNEIGLDNSENLLRGALYSASYRKDQTGEFARERTLIQYGDKYQPIKKYAVNLSEMTVGNKAKYLTAPKKWYLHIEGFYRDFIAKREEIDGIELSQDFCLIITIRDDKKKQNVYDQATKLLNESGFIHNNINLRSEVRIPVNNQ
ncbi:S8 family peptidase [Chryseobacterium sp.]|uniref:S8 family peptidase n=1 Tax=Chryseobacterium sp. TaxID=1871047 RepID=UPI0031DD6BA1